MENFRWPVAFCSAGIDAKACAFTRESVLRLWKTAMRWSKTSPGCRAGQSQKGLKRGGAEDVRPENLAPACSPSISNSSSTASRPAPASDSVETVADQRLAFGQWFARSVIARPTPACHPTQHLTPPTPAFTILPRPWFGFFESGGLAARAADAGRSGRPPGGSAGHWTSSATTVGAAALPFARFGHQTPSAVQDSLWSDAENRRSGDR